MKDKKRTRINTYFCRQTGNTIEIKTTENDPCFKVPIGRISLSPSNDSRFYQYVLIKIGDITEEDV